MQGSAKLRENLKPNEKPVEVQEKVQDNIRQVKTVAGNKHSKSNIFVCCRFFFFFVYLLRCYGGLSRLKACGLHVDDNPHRSSFYR